MTPAGVESRVNDLRERVRTGNGYEEQWHVIEDRIWADVLLAIANREPQAIQLAQAALKTTEIDFARGYA